VTDDAETRDRLLEAAERLFADRGFKKVSVRDICRAAHANVAAVNYHFGSKLSLYREVLKTAIDGMRTTTETARQEGEGQPPEEKLRLFLTIFLNRLLTSTSETLHRLIHREMNDPTPALDDLVERGVRPRVEYLKGIVAELMGVSPADPRVLRCVASINSQPFVYMPNPIAARLGFVDRRTPEWIDEVARHITAFSLGGVQAVARTRRIEAEARTRDMQAVVRTVSEKQKVAGRRRLTAASPARPRSRSRHGSRSRHRT
jgi:TetR/AcrR family transcriptional regulator, regulator of cefoperazone and chloramphenicol sensitivity